MPAIDYWIKDDGPKVCGINRYSFDKFFYEVHLRGLGYRPATPEEQTELEAGARKALAEWERDWEAMQRVRPSPTPAAGGGVFSSGGTRTDTEKHGIHGEMKDE